MGNLMTLADAERCLGRKPQLLPISSYTYAMFIAELFVPVRTWKKPERPPKRVFLLERPFPRISENTVADANSKRFIFRYTGTWGGRVSRKTCAPSGCGKGFL